jgi:alpha-aminoadipic semialdehyde synthase
VPIAALQELFSQPETPRLRVIGDISCDIEGSIECTRRITTPDSPVYVYAPLEDAIQVGFAGNGVVIMAIDNLPAEIPLESSIFFSNALKPYIPAIARAEYSGDFSDCRLPDAVKRAVILYNGDFTPDYAYMREYIA